MVIVADEYETITDDELRRKWLQPWRPETPVSYREMPEVPALAGEWPVYDKPLVQMERFTPARVWHVPTQARRDYELGLYAVDLCEMAGLDLDDWQTNLLTNSLRSGPDGHWAAIEVGACVPRQNGKGSILEARELVALFIDERRWPMAATPLTIHSAHEAATASEAFGRLWGLIEDTASFHRKVRGKPTQGVGSQVIRMRDGRRIQFRTRTKSGGRGYSCGLLILDEAMILAETAHEAMFSAVTAQPNCQVWYTGSAADKESMDKAKVFTRVRNRGVAGEDEDLMFVEYSLPYDDPSKVPAEVAMDPEAWKRANPSLDIRLSRRVIAAEQRSLSSRGYARERLGVGAWPKVDAEEWVIPRGTWDAIGDPEATPLDPVAFAFDVSPLRTYSAVAVCGRDVDGNYVLELLKAEADTDWLVPFILERHKNNRRAPWVYEAAGPAASMAPQLETERVNALPITAGQYAAGCGAIVDAAEADPSYLRHREDQRLTDALAVTEKRDVGDRFAWARRKSTGDITSWVAATLAFTVVQGLTGRSSQIVDPAELLADEAESNSFDVASLPPV